MPDRPSRTTRGELRRLEAKRKRASKSSERNRDEARVGETVRDLLRQGKPPATIERPGWATKWAAKKIEKAIAREARKAAKYADERNLAAEKKERRAKDLQIELRVRQHPFVVRSVQARDRVERDREAAAGRKRMEPRPRHEELDLHHRTYERIFHESTGDVIWLCRTCHEKVHDAWSAEKTRRLPGGPSSGRRRTLAEVTDDFVLMERMKRMWHMKRDA